MALVMAARRAPSGGCSSRFRGQTDAGPLTLLRYNDKASAIGLAALIGRSVPPGASVFSDLCGSR